MIYSQTYSEGIFDTIGILNSFTITISGTLWKSYEKFAVNKLNKADLEIKGLIYSLNEITPKQAQKELKTISAFIPVFDKFKKHLNTINDAEFLNVKKAALNFINSFETLYQSFYEIAHVHDLYIMSENVLADDWNSEADKHWDNY
jgi:hypothetical protein